MNWFQERLYEHHKQMLSMESVLYHWRTEFQDVLIFENATFGKVLVLDGIVQWSDDGVRRPRGALMYKCPEGDVTGDELAACTVWEGVIYTSDGQGNIELLPAEGVDAPKTLIFPDLGPSLRFSAAYGSAGFSKVPRDVFALKGCQE